MSDITFRLLKAWIECQGYEVGTIGDPDSWQYQDFKVTKHKRTRKAKEVTYSDEFELAWKLYPDKQGNKKKAAYIQWNNRLKGMSTGYESVMIDGTRRYAAYCKATEKPEQFVNQASTFYGPEQLYLQSWDIPKQVTQIKLPRINEDLPKFARDNDLPPPNRGEEYPAYRRRLENEINKRIES
jgi:hypothetical protein